jgi:hypothetical protein
MRGLLFPVLLLLWISPVKASLPFDKIALVEYWELTKKGAKSQVVVQNRTPETVTLTLVKSSGREAADTLSRLGPLLPGMVVSIPQWFDPIRIKFKSARVVVLMNGQPLGDYAIMEAPVFPLGRLGKGFVVASRPNSGLSAGCFYRYDRLSQKVGKKIKVEIFLPTGEQTRMQLPEGKDYALGKIHTQSTAARDLTPVENMAGFYKVSGINPVFTIYFTADADMSSQYGHRDFYFETGPRAGRTQECPILVGPLANDQKKFNWKTLLR